MLTSQRRLLVLPILILACETEEAPPAAPARAPALAAPSPDPMAAEDAELIAYAYSPVGKRDPFRNVLVDDTVPAPGPITALQKWNLDELKLIAVVTGTPVPYAMIEDPNGKGHVVRRGSLIGRNFGRVREVRAEEIVVREEYRTYTGAKHFSDVKFEIKPPKLDLGDEI